MKTKDYLDQRQLSYQLFSHEPTYTAQNLAVEENISPIKVAKPVVIAADESFYMCVLPASMRIDLEILSWLLGAETIRLATEEEMLELFPECELGAEPPIGAMFGLPTILDKRLTRVSEIVFQAGSHCQAVRIKTSEFAHLVEPQILDFCY